MYTKSLESCITANCSGSFEKLLLALCQERIELKCDYIRKAESRIGSEEELMIQLICPCSHKELMKLNETYRNLFGQDLTFVLESQPEGEFKTLMLHLLRASFTSPELVIDDKKAEVEAQLLFAEGAGRVGIDTPLLIEVLTHRQPPHRCKVRKIYEEISGSPFQNALKSDCSENFRSAFIALVTPQPEYTADLFHEAFSENNDDQIIRLLSTSTKRQLMQTSREFMNKHERSLQGVILSQCSGAYQDLACRLIIENVDN